MIKPAFIPLRALFVTILAGAMASGTVAAQDTASAKPVTLTAAERAVYVGRYTFSFKVESEARTLVVNVADEDGRLVVWAEGKAKIPLIAFGNHVFGMKEDPRLRLTFTVVDGRVTRALLEEPDEQGVMGKLDGVPMKRDEKAIDYPPAARATPPLQPHGRGDRPAAPSHTR